MLLRTTPRLGGRWLAYLFGLAFPRLLRVIRPLPGKSRLPRLDHARVERVHLGQVPELLLDGSNNSPAAVGHVLEVFDQRIVVLFPAIQMLVAQEADDIVRVRRCGLEDEAGSGKLLHTQG